MTEAELQELIAQGETLTVEFKSDRRDGLSDHELQEAVVCLANHEGGRLLIGVEDNGTITGLHQRHAATTPGALASALRNFLLGSMPPDIRCEYVPTPAGPVAVVTVSRAKAPVSTSKSVTVRRGIGPDGQPQCLPVGPDELVYLRATRGLYDHSARALPDLTFESISRAELDRIRGFIRAQPQATKSLAELNDHDLAVALKLIVRHEGSFVPTILGLLLAGVQDALEEHVPTHSVALQDLDAERNVLANDFYREPLLRIWERFDAFFAGRNTEREVKLGLGLQRTAIPRYPSRAVREAFANALVHRDYTLLGAVQFQFRDRDGDLEISNPGGLVDGVTERTILTSGSIPRNEHLAEAFRHLGLVERSGRGVPRIFEDVLSLGRPAPTYKATVRKVTVTIPGGEADAKFVEMVLRAQDQHQRMDWKHLLALHHLSRVKELSVHHTAELLESDDAQARRVLEDMVDWGLLERRGRNKHTYHLSAGVYRELDQRTEYVHRKGVEDFRQEQLVLDFLTTNGRIRRAEVEQLCRIDESQADYLLRRMREEGRIDIGQRGRYAFYVLPSALAKPEANSESNSGNSE